MVEGFLDPSVAQPPLPLQLFLPLQPLSPALQPPLPLQSFLPLQECLSLSSMPTRRTPACVADFDAEALAGPLLVFGAWAEAEVPPTKPVRAAVSMSAFREFFIVISSIEIVGGSTPLMATVRRHLNCRTHPQRSCFAP